MKVAKILIVDDEKNIRMTIAQALENMGLEIDTAVNGEEALSKLKGTNFDLLLLDLLMPGINGMDVLRELSQERPEVRIIVITAHGTIDSSVEAMKLGAVDFLQKPFTPKEIREIVAKFIKLQMPGGKTNDYMKYLDMAKHCLFEKHLDAAVEHVKKAISIDSSLPEAFNFLGALYEKQGNKLEGQKNYRVALSLNSGYKPAQNNLSRCTGTKPESGCDIIIDEKTSIEMTD